MKTIQIMAKVKRTYKKEGLTCEEGKLCEPEGFFEMLEKCKKCNKII